jgi:hypothetical protein
MVTAAMKRPSERRWSRKWPPYCLIFDTETTLDPAQKLNFGARELGFLDRLALLVDQQWNWRQNQALARRVRASRLKGTACVGEHRLPRRTRTEQECDPCARSRLGMGQEPRTHFRTWPYRRGQELCFFGPGAESVSMATRCTTRGAQRYSVT